jgi:hypothetical protein
VVGWIRAESESSAATPRAWHWLAFACRVATTLVLLFACWTCIPAARADVGVILNESLDTSVARITGSGHSAIYFSRICPESPVKLRLCRPDEHGSVLSNYTTLGEDQPFEWNIVPLSMYLYGVEDPANRPLFGNWRIKRALEERYRDNVLAAYCVTQSCRTSGKAEWREMVGATLERSLYMFIVSTTLEQDEDFIADFNGLPNKNHFNGVTNNCANFTRRVLNAYFPNAAHPDYINDFGMTSPKAIARSFSHYAERHPDSHFYVLHFAQLPGTIKRSTEARSGTEQLYRSKKLLVPMLIFADHALPFVAASYVLTGRFNPEHELEHYPNADVTEIDQEIRDAKADSDEPRKDELQSFIRDEDAELVGTAQEWKEYHSLYDSLADEAVRRELIPDRDFISRVYKFLDHASAISLESNGSVWLKLDEGGKVSTLGASASNILAPATDSQWAYILTLARANHYLKSPKHSREIMPDFKQDWSLLESARAGSSVASITASASPAAPGVAPAPRGHLP